MKKEVFSEFFFTLKKYKLSLFIIFFLSFITLFLLMKYLDKNSDDYLMKLNTAIINHEYKNAFYTGINDYMHIELKDLNNYISFDENNLEIFFKIQSIEEVNILNSKVELVIDEYMENVYNDANSIINSFSKVNNQNFYTNLNSMLYFDSLRLFEDYGNEFKLYEINKKEGRVIVRKFNDVENIIISFFISFCILAMYLILQMFRRNLKIS